MTKKKIRFVMALSVATLLLVFASAMVIFGIYSNDSIKQTVVSGLTAAVQALVGGLIGTVCGFYFTATEDTEKEETQKK